MSAADGERTAFAGATAQLAAFAANLRYEDIPEDVLETARNTIADGVACCVFGYDFPWSQALLRHATRWGGSGGRSAVLGRGAPLLHPPMAALVNGALAHAFELDAGTKKGVGAHPFGTVFTGALPIAQDRGRSGRDLLVAFVAGSEVMLRIGWATGRSNEARGFHAPGTTGPFGSGVAGALLFGLDAAGVRNALGIAGSTPSGLKAFSQAETGSMVKRLHFGRGAEGGVLAAGLAAEGFEGPETVLEGRYGFLDVYCDTFDREELTRGLDGSLFRMREIAMKRFAAHGAAQGPLAALLDLKAQTPFGAGQIDAILVEGAPEAVTHHDGLVVHDLMQAQYSVPFCVALACVADIRDARVMNEAALRDPAVLGLFERVRYVAGPMTDKRACRVTVRLSDGRVLVNERKGIDATWRSASTQETYEKYALLMRDVPGSEQIFERIQTLEQQPDLDWLTIPA